jgi:hypothetical protein
VQAPPPLMAQTVELPMETVNCQQVQAPVAGWGHWISPFKTGSVPEAAPPETATRRHGEAVDAARRG